MSRRNTYILGGLTAAIGIVLVVVAIIALTSGDGEESGQTVEPNQPERPLTPESPAPPDTGDTGERRRPAVDAEGAAIRSNLARRRAVRAPRLSAPVIHDGTLAAPLRDPFERATGGGTLTLSELRGTPVVLYLWSSRCAPCRPNARLVEASWKRWGPRGVLFVGVSVNEPADQAQPVIRQYDLTFPVVSDPNGGIAERYGATALPQTFFISEGGDIVGEVAGSASVRHLETGAAAAESGSIFGAQQGSGRVPLE